MTATVPLCTPTAVGGLTFDCSAELTGELNMGTIFAAQLLVRPHAA